MTTTFRRRQMLAAGLGILLFSSRARAAGLEGEDFRLEVSWAGLHVADVALTYQVNGDQITAGMAIESRGIAAFATDYGGNATARCRLVGDTLMPESYAAHFKSRRYTREIGFRYDEHGMPQDLVLKKRDDDQTSPVPPALWRDTVDPLTGILRMRRWLAAKDGPETLRVPFFDARTRYDGLLTRLPDQGDERRAKLVVEPLAGSSKSSWLANWENDDGRWVETRVSGDGRAVPLLLVTRDTTTTSSIELAKDCSGATRCG